MQLFESIIFVILCFIIFETYWKHRSISNCLPTVSWNG